MVWMPDLWQRAPVFTLSHKNEWALHSICEAQHLCGLWENKHIHLFLLLCNRPANDRRFVANLYFIIIKSRKRNLFIYLRILQHYSFKIMKEGEKRISLISQCAYTHTRYYEIPSSYVCSLQMYYEHKSKKSHCHFLDVVELHLSEVLLITATEIPTHMEGRQ